MYKRNQNTLHVWCIDYCSLSTSKSYYNTQHLIQHSTVCIATLIRTKDNDEWFKHESRWTRNNNPAKWSNDINPTRSQCDPLNLPSHQGRQTQEHTIHQRRKEAGGVCCISKWFGSGEWAKSNSNVVWLDLWFLKCWNWEVSPRWIKMEFERQYDEFAGKRGAPPGKEQCLMWIAGWAKGQMMVMEECRMKLWGANPGQGAPIQRKSPSMLSITEREGNTESGIEERRYWSRLRRGLRSAHSWGGAPTEMQYGALNEISKRQSRLRIADWNRGVPTIAKENYGGGGGIKQHTMCNWWVQWRLE